jgi:hypothetical protein
MHTLTAAVVGASGYSGLELTRLLSRHPRLRLNAVTSDRWAGEKVSARLPLAPPLGALAYRPLGESDAGVCVRPIRVGYELHNIRVDLEKGRQTHERGSVLYQQLDRHNTASRCRKINHLESIGYRNLAHCRRQAGGEEQDCQTEKQLSCHVTSSISICRKTFFRSKHSYLSRQRRDYKLIRQKSLRQRFRRRTTFLANLILHLIFLHFSNTIFLANCRSPMRNRYK